MLGLALGRSEPTADEAGVVMKTSLLAAAGALEVAAIEYTEAVPEGEVIKEQEYEGALAALQSSRSKYRDVRAAVASLFPSEASAIDRLYARADALMSQPAPASEVVTALEDLESLLNPDSTGSLDPGA